VVAEKASGTAFAATWRDRAGDVVGTTWGGTMCWFPRLGWRLRIAREGFEHIVRCGECPGCLEFERRRLADRLSEKYGAHGEQLAPDEHTLRRSADGKFATTRRRARRPPYEIRAPGAVARGQARGELFIVRIYAALEQHARIAHMLHRRRGLRLEPGFFRMGRGSFCVLSRDRVVLSAVLRLSGFQSRVEKVRWSRGRRAWRSLTAGIAVSREAYGEQTKRWYARGLPPADQQKWEVVKIGKYSPYDRWRAPRAWKSGNLVLVPPEVWAMRRVDRVALRKQMSLAATPELAAAIAQVVAAQSSLSLAVAASKSQSDRPQAAPSKRLPPLIEVGGYVSSAHTQSEFWASPRSDDDLSKPGTSGDPIWMERERERSAQIDQQLKARKDRVLQESLEIIERMKKRAEKRGRDG